jgi:hypothetical protein
MFLLAVVGLSCLSKHSFSSELHGLKVAPTAPAVSHLLFADGSLLPFKAETVVVAKVQGVLDLYCMASGQQINRDKSSIFFSKRCPGAIKEGVKLTLQVQSESLNEKYLGMPLDVGRAKDGAFKYLKDKVWSRIQGWLEKLFLAGGKDILIKSVSQAISIFSMACFRLPIGLCLHINSMLRKFWWSSKEGERKPSWVS